MAMAWIESHQSLSRHHKTLRAAALLGCDRHKLIGHLHELWWWAVDNVPADGALGACTDADLETAAQWDGAAGTFAAALVAAGFLDAGPDGRAIHDWYEFAGKLLVRRADNAARQRRKRERDGAAPDARDITRTSRARHGATVPNRTVPPLLPLLPAASPPPPPPLASVADATNAPPLSRAKSGALTRAAQGHPFADLWQAFDAACGPALSRNEKGRRAKACQDARDAGVTAAQVGDAAAHWSNVMSDAILTDTGLVANLGKLLFGPQRNGRDAGVVRQRVQRLTERATVTRGGADDWRPDPNWAGRRRRPATPDPPDPPDPPGDAR